MSKIQQPVGLAILKCITNIPESRFLIFDRIDLYLVRDCKLTEIGRLGNIIFAKENESRGLVECSLCFRYQFPSFRHC